MHDFHTLNTTSAGSTPGVSKQKREKPKKYGANAPHLRAIWPQAAPGAMRQHPLAPSPSQMERGPGGKKDTGYLYKGRPAASATLRRARRSKAFRKSLILLVGIVVRAGWWSGAMGPLRSPCKPSYSSNEYSTCEKLRLATIHRQRVAATETLGNYVHCDV